MNCTHRLCREVHVAGNTNVKFPHLAVVIALMSSCIVSTTDSTGALIAHVERFELPEKNSDSHRLPPRVVVNAAVCLALIFPIYPIFR